jgi:hypothetical protein
MNRPGPQRALTSLFLRDPFYSYIHFLDYKVGSVDISEMKIRTDLVDSTLESLGFLKFYDGVNASNWLRRPAKNKE